MDISVQTKLRPGGYYCKMNKGWLLKTFDYAKKVGIKTVAITAFDGGKIKQMADEGVHVPTAPKEYGPAEDAHMVLDHLVGAYLMRVIKHG